MKKITLVLLAACSGCTDIAGGIDDVGIPLVPTIGIVYDCELRAVTGTPEIKHDTYSYSPCLTGESEAAAFQDQWVNDTCQPAIAGYTGGGCYGQCQAQNKLCEIKSE